jgi:O-antigen/teichoic acid export membrane protein
MRKIYTGIGLVFSLLLISIGTIALNKPINEVNNIFDAWLAWSIICIIAVIEFQGKIYKNYLEGLFKVALVKRVETLFRVGSIVTSLLVLTFAPTLLNLVIANRIWSIFNVLRDRYLARKVNDEVFKSFKPQPFSKELFSDIWKPAWRSGLSGVMSNGLTQLTGVLYAQVGISASLASYLMGLKIINEIRNFSNASFYSKIPVLAKLRAKGDIKQLIQVARKNINIAYTIFFLSVLGIGLFSDRLIEFIGSETAFVSADLWWLLGIAFLIHRIGGFQMQIYVSTNHIISHWVDGISGIIFLTTTFLLLDSFGVYAFVYAMILSYGTIYFFVSSFYSFKSLNLTTKQFIGYFFMLPLVFLLIFTVCYYLSINV